MRKLLCIVFSVILLGCFCVTGCEKGGQDVKMKEAPPMPTSPPGVTTPSDAEGESSGVPVER
jgi:hypothetical protein